MTRLRASAVAAVAMACACSPPGETHLDFTLPDSVPVRYTVAPTQPDSWRIGTSPVLVLGRPNGPEGESFDGIVAAFHLTDGRLVVVDRGTRQVRTYAPDGDYLGWFGGPGQGPGELGTHSGPTRAWRLAGDTIAVWVFEDRRMSFFTADGAFVRSTRFEAIEGVPPDMIGPLSDGTFVARGPKAIYAPPPDHPVGYRWREMESHVRYDLNGAVVGTMARAPSWDFVVGKNDDGSVSADRMTFGRFTGRTVAGDRLAIATGDRFEVWLFDRGGRLVGGIRRPDPERSITERDRDVFLAETEERAPPEANARRIFLRSLETTVFADSLPATRFVESDVEGFLWVSEFHRPGASHVGWSVFQAEGTWVADLAFPVGVRVRSIERDRIVGVSADLLGVERVLVYSLERPASGT